MNDPNPHLNDRELKALAAEIDRLAFEDGGDAGLEARIYAASLPVLHSAGRPTLRLVQGEAPAGRRRARGTRRVSMRVAAGFAVAAAAALAWMGTHRVSPSAVTEAPVVAAAAPAGEDEWAIASAVFDDAAADELSQLYNAASTLRIDLDSIGTGESYEEAM